ncbi:hypothetical protein ACFQ0M_03815 [Kitasatospora aburaviensis]
MKHIRRSTVAALAAAVLGSLVLTGPAVARPADALPPPRSPRSPIRSSTPRTRAVRPSTPARRPSGPRPRRSPGPRRSGARRSG